MTARTGAARTRDASRSRTQILDAAEGLFATAGFHGVSLSTIARRAEVSPALLVYFFQSKAGLYDEVIARVLARRDVALNEVADEASTLLDECGGHAALRHLVGGYIDYLLGNPTFVPLLTLDALAHASRREDKPRHARHFAARTMDIMVRAEVPEATSDPDQLFLSLIAMCYFPLEHDTTLVAGMGHRAWSRAFRDKRVDHIVSLLMRDRP